MISQGGSRTALKEYTPLQVGTRPSAATVCVLISGTGINFKFYHFLKSACSCWHKWIFIAFLSKMRNIQDLTKLVILYEKLTYLSKYCAFLLSAQDVFTYLNHRSYANLDLSAYVSFFEIYNGKVRKNLLLSWTHLLKITNKTPGCSSNPESEIYFFDFRFMTCWTRRPSCGFWRMTDSRFRSWAWRRSTCPQQRKSSRWYRLGVHAGILCEKQSFYQSVESGGLA